jgi:hypothetical protein
LGCVVDGDFSYRSGGCAAGLCAALMSLANLWQIAPRVCNIGTVLISRRFFKL